MAVEIVPDRSGYVLSEGYEVWYEYFGDGKREAVALLNGLAMSTRAWYGFLPMLTDEFDVFANSRWRPIAECGHVAYLERPEVLFPTLKSFMCAKSVEF